MTFQLISKPFNSGIIPGSNYFQNKDCVLSYNHENDFKELDNLGIFIDGYVLPRLDCFEKYKPYSPHKLIQVLFCKYGKDFIQMVKGVFTLIIFDKNEVLVFNDQLGINKCFFYILGDHFIISNNYKNITDLIKQPSLDFQSIARNSLFHHYISGNTFIKGIEYLTPASCVVIADGKIRRKQFFNYSDLRNSIQKELTYNDFASQLKILINNYLDYLNPGKISITLTGGKDSRTILAGLLSLGKNPFTFTYGNPESGDAFYSAKIARGLNLDYDILNPVPDEKWFEAYYSKIINLNNPLINVHRAHRLFSFTELKARVGEDTIFFGGYMGGEMLMGLYYDDLIFTSSLRKYWKGLGSIESIVLDSLEYNFIERENVDVNNLIESISALSFINESERKMWHFHAAFEIGVLHHSQDINLGMKLIKYSVPFFIDVDFLELLFQTKFNLIYQDNQSKNPFKRYELVDFNLNIQHILYPALDKYYFAKKGYFNTKEFLGNKAKLTFLRAYRNYTSHHNFKPTFSYGKSYKNFIYSELIKIRENSNNPLHEIFNVNKAIITMNQNDVGSQEKHWHRFTNIYMLDRFINHYQTQK
jgi:hypothetical protein